MKPKAHPAAKPSLIGRTVDPAMKALFSMLIGAFGLSLLLCSPVRAQDAPPGTVTGTVTDSLTEEPLPGVNVLVQGTTTGAATNTNGEYAVSVESFQDTLSFSFIGYQTLEVPINGRREIDVEMRRGTISGEEVVVTALGIEQQERALGYSVATVEPEEMTVNRTTNFMDALQGKIPGVNISSMATGASGTSKIRIRGQSSLTGQNDPLIVVDGIPIDNTSFGVTSGGPGIKSSDTGDGLLSINPDNIESMNVLKGGTAAALYGSRAKDGVIMITTKKRGPGNGISVSLRANYKADVPINDLDYQMQYGQGERGNRPTSPNPTSGSWSFGERFKPGMTQILFDGIEVPYEPAGDRIHNFFDVGQSLTNTISLSSGSDNGGFNITLSRLSNQGIMPNASFRRYNASVGFTQDITPKLNVSGSINYSQEKDNNSPNTAGQSLAAITGLYTMSNSMPLDVLRENRYNESGGERIWTRFTPRINPYFYLSEVFNHVNRDRVFGNVALRYDFSESVYVQGRIGQDYYSRDQAYNTPTGVAFLSPAPSGFVNGEYTQLTQEFREVNADVLVGAYRQFGNIGVDLTLGGNLMYRRSDQKTANAEDFLVRDLYTVANGRSKTPGFGYSERQVNSLYGDAEVSYKNYLFANVTARNDWFSTLAPQNRSILYPSVNGSFVFSEFFAGLPDWLTFGKLRAAYAEVGSDTDVAPFSQSLFYSVNSNLFPDPTGAGQPVGQISSGTIPNENLKPMRVSEAEFGFNLRMFNRVDLDFTYYNKRTSDQILTTQVSDASGFGQQLVNVGESVSRGMELLFGVTPVQNEAFSWDFTLNGSYNASEVLDLGPNDMITVGGALFPGRCGRSLGSLWGSSLPMGISGMSKAGRSSIPTMDFRCRRRPR